jgi:hypothetical protein
MDSQFSLAGETGASSTDCERENLKVFASFDTPAAEAEAMATVEYVRAQLGKDACLQLSTWNIAYLTAPRLGKRASADAVEADMLIFAIHREASAASELKTWISKLTLRRNKGGALVALLPASKTAEHSPLFASLEQAAMAAEMDFIAKFCQALV